MKDLYLPSVCSLETTGNIHMLTLKKRQWPQKLRPQELRSSLQMVFIDWTVETHKWNWVRGCRKAVSGGRRGSFGCQRSDRIWRKGQDKKLKNCGWFYAWDYLLTFLKTAAMRFIRFSFPKALFPAPVKGKRQPCHPRKTSSTHLLFHGSSWSTGRNWRGVFV